MEVRLPLMLGRGLAVAAGGARVLDGVPVLGVEVADVAADNCFVGDLVGDWWEKLETGLTYCTSLLDLLEACWKDESPGSPD